MAESKAYSAIIQDFIEPIRCEEDTEQLFFNNCEIGRLIWNYCIALEFDLKIKDSLFETIKQACIKDLDFEITFDLLVFRKLREFRGYTNFILTLGREEGPNGKTIFVESMPGEKVKELETKGNGLPSLFQ